MKKAGLIIIAVFLLNLFQQSPAVYGASYNDIQPQFGKKQEEELPGKDGGSKTDDKQQDLKPLPSKTVAGGKTEKTKTESKQKIPELKKIQKKSSSTSKKKQEQQEKKKPKTVKFKAPSKISPLGYCCDDGTLKMMSEIFCGVKNGRYFPTNQKGEADMFCRRLTHEVGYCCISKKKVIKLDKNRCRKEQGTYYPVTKKLEAYAGCRILTGQQSQEDIGNLGTGNNNLQPEMSGRIDLQNTPTYRRLPIQNQAAGSSPIQSTQVVEPNRTETEQEDWGGGLSLPDQSRQDTPEKVDYEQVVVPSDPPQPSYGLPSFELDPLPKAEEVRNEIVVSLDGSANEQEFLSYLSKTFQLELIDFFTLKSLGHQVAVFTTIDDPAAIISELGRQKGVLSAQPNNVFTTMGEPMTAMQNLSRVVNFDVLHSRYRGKSIRIGIVDTGVDYSHQELRQRVVYYQNFFSGSDYMGEIHGTAVAGIIGASLNGKGIQGVAPEADLYAFRGCRQQKNNSSMGLCYSTTIAKALDAAIDNQVHLVSLCLGSSSSDKLVSALLEAGVYRDILFIAPAGNMSDQSVLAFPASHKDVIAVAGIDATGKGLPNPSVASMANVRAPAVKVLAPVPGNRYNFMDGTSMASAAVAGVLALVLEKHGNLSREFLYSKSADLKEYIGLFFVGSVVQDQPVAELQVDEKK